MATITCPDCLSGSVKEGTPTGTTTTIHGLDVYVARPEGTLKGLIVFIPDIFGWEMSNSRLLADSFAKEGGFLVYLPNFMNGKYQTLWLFNCISLILQAIFQQHLICTQWTPSSRHPHQYSPPSSTNQSGCSNSSSSPPSLSSYPTEKPP